MRAYGYAVSNDCAAVYVSLRNLLVLELVREKRFMGALGLLCVIEGLASIIGGFVAGNIIDGSGPISLHQTPGQRAPLAHYSAAYVVQTRAHTSARVPDRPPPSPFNGALHFAATMLAVGTVLSLILMCLARSDRKKRESRRRRAKNKRARRHAADVGPRRERERETADADAAGNPFPSDAELPRPHGARDTRRGSPDAHESDASSPSRSSGGRAPSPPHLSDRVLGPPTLRPPSNEASASHSRDSLPRPHSARDTAPASASAPVPAPSAPASSSAPGCSTRALVHNDAVETPAASGSRLPGARSSAVGMRTSASGSSSSGIGVGCGCCEPADAQAAGQSPSAQAPLAAPLKPSEVDGDASSPLLVASTTQRQ